MSSPMVAILDSGAAHSFARLANQLEAVYLLYFGISASHTQISSNLKKQWSDYPSPVWRGADIINKQRAQLAINNLKETSQYCQPLSNSSTSFPDVAPASSTSTPASSIQSTTRPTTLTSDLFQLQPPNQACHILRLQGTMENNLKAELEQYINDVHKKHLTEVFIFHLFNHFYTHLYTQLCF